MFYTGCILFQLLETVFSSAAKERKQDQENAETSGCNDDDGDGASEASAATKEDKDFDDDDHGLQRAHKVDTTLLVYFFGRRGTEQGGGRDI